MNINTASDIVHSIVEDFNFEDWDFSVMVSRQFLIYMLKEQFMILK